MSELQSLPLFHTVAGQTVLVLGEGDAAEPKRRLVERAGGIVIDDERRAVDEGVRIAFVAFDDARACEVAAINLRCAGMLVNVVDRPDLCDFTTPSILDRNPVLIAVGTGGASAGLAKHLRLRLERILPASLGQLAEALFAARQTLRERFPDGNERRRALDEALREGGVLDPLDSAAHQRVNDWLNKAELPNEATTHIFTLSSADPEDLTLKQVRLLGQADAVCADPGISPQVLARARADARRSTCDPATCPAALGTASACPKADPSAGSTGLTIILRCDTAV
ncbi:precorrin-2 dehydrogenase/sirohydrochlorin ferrochelatase family protein [Qipengyuania sp. ASV99]|uniref:precorrin-2 dehydrogenase/sirohydrochlorin ferrochelatase family protein n=1 Tax=Qipengyuania sp. ASV99 TaxID=3399681 RepID=UPI003A4C785B